MVKVSTSSAKKGTTRIWRPTLVGTQVSNIQDLHQPDQYYLYTVQTGSIYISLRRTMSRHGSELPISDYHYSLQLHVAPSSRGEHLILLADELYHLFTGIYNQLLRSYSSNTTSYGINISTNFQNIEGQLNTTFRNFNEENRSQAILEAIDQLFRYSQSAKIGQIITKLQAVFTITAIRPEGNGILLPIW